MKSDSEIRFMLRGMSEELIYAKEMQRMLEPPSPALEERIGWLEDYKDALEWVLGDNETKV